MIRSGIRAKLILGFTLAIVIQGAITGLVGVSLFYDRTISQAKAEVTGALNWAREIYEGRLRAIKDTVRLSATRGLVVNALTRGDRAFLAAELEQIRKVEGLDTLTITDAAGRVVIRARNNRAFGDDRSTNPLVAAALKERRPVWGTVIVPREELLLENARLAERAHIEPVETPRAKPVPERSETSGLMQAAAAPVLDASGRLIGVLYGGVLLNRNEELVDRIKKTAFGEEAYKGRDLGTATIFQGDMRIATNVRTREGVRAIGTRVSREVREAVLEQGRKWTDEAFVVNEWYITAYEPIRDVLGRRIGILYVGLLKQPYTDSLWQTLSIFIGIALLGIALVILIAALIAGKLTRPLRDMARIAHRITEGDHDVRIEVASKDELGELAEAFNKMTAQISKMLGELREWARTLEHKVDQRSREIQAMQGQLMQSEKLASLGKLAAGVAHEINNPMTGILTNASLLYEDLPAEDPAREDLKTIIDETIRCRRIVKGLLDFARQSRPEKKKVPLNEIIQNSLNLLRNQASFRNIEIAEQLDPFLPEVSADPNQIQQVCVNILINASEAMNGAGKIQIISRRADRMGQWVEVSISDTGPGIGPEARSKLFDPFFTTKATGTGLGLAVSYGIVQSHGGTIDLKSEPGQGATFIIRLPTASEEPLQQPASTAPSRSPANRP